MTFESPGSPALSKRVRDLLADGGITARPTQRGLDHGVFVPLRSMFAGKTDIPIVQVSLYASEDPAKTIALGEALAPLRDDGVLIIGGGMAVHNLRDVRADSRIAADGAVPAADGHRSTAGIHTHLQRCAHRRAHVVHGRRSRATGRGSIQALRLPPSSCAPVLPATPLTLQPTAEHLLPAYVALGAAGADEGELTFSFEQGSMAYSDFRFGSIESTGEQHH